jgi:hypothetical protein
LPVSTPPAVKLVLPVPPFDTGIAVPGVGAASMFSSRKLSTVITVVIINIIINPTVNNFGLIVGRIIHALLIFLP